MRHVDESATTRISGLVDNSHGSPAWSTARAWSNGFLWSFEITTTRKYRQRSRTWFAARAINYGSMLDEVRARQRKPCSAFPHPGDPFLLREREIQQDCAGKRHSDSFHRGLSISRCINRPCIYLYWLKPGLWPFSLRLSAHKKLHCRTGGQRSLETRLVALSWETLTYTTDFIKWRWRKDTCIFNAKADGVEVALLSLFSFGSSVELCK